MPFYLYIIAIHFREELNECLLRAELTDVFTDHVFIGCNNCYWLNYTYSYKPTKHFIG